MQIPQLQLSHNAADSVWKLDPSDSASHVLLGNILASTGNWGEVAKIPQLQLSHNAADSVWKLDPSDSASHVLLGNILASTGNWGEVARVRRLMRVLSYRVSPETNDQHNNIPNSTSHIKVKDKISVSSNFRESFSAVMVLGTVGHQPFEINLGREQIHPKGDKNVCRVVSS
ncbi:hypothetical protein IFM89_026498 [Coptis chinensis]|uniref:Uncharacterized protein n=1 Tax=Coptis chinensis TaxID=261450 RepID=A0A835M157_9MAGN|nr:hypothetical protein IFM89_026498 [Coptis chinensis]